MYSIKLTNCLASPLKLNYRMPRAEKSALANPVLSVMLQPRALLNDVNFPSENHYNEFKKQNATFFTNGSVIEGKTTEKQAVANNAKVSEAKAKTAKSKIKKTAEALQASAEQTGAKLEIKEVEKAGN